MSKNEKHRAELQKKFEADTQYVKWEKRRWEIVNEVQDIEIEKRKLLELLKEALTELDTIKTKISNQ